MMPHKLLILLCIPWVFAGCAQNNGGDKNKVKKNEVVSDTGRKYYIQFHDSMFTGLKEGDTLLIKALDHDTLWTLKVRRHQETIPGIYGIMAQLGGKADGVANLVYREGSLAGSITDYNSDASFEIRYDSTRQSHYLNMIDRNAEDKLPGGKPLRPGEVKN